MFVQVCCTLLVIFSVAYGQFQFSNLSQAPQAQKVKVSIFYESLCPDSVKFITETFYPIYGHLRPYINLQLIPFGKSDVSAKGEYHCQHGQKECRRNVLQACVLNELPEQDDQLRFVNCAMSRSSLTDYEQCASEVGISWNSVQVCANGPLGLKLILANQAETRSKTDGPSFVPSIVYNDVFDKQDNLESFTDPLKVICRKLTVKVPFCGNQDAVYLPV